MSQVRSQSGKVVAVHPFDMLRTGLAYNLGNFVRRLALPEGIKYWSQTGVQTWLIKIGERLVRHARRLVFQFRLCRESSMKSGLAEVMMRRGYVQ